MRRGSDVFFRVVAEVVDGMMDGMRLAADEWLSATLELMLGMKARDDAQPRLWQQQRLRSDAEEAAKAAGAQGQQVPPSASTPTSAAHPPLAPSAGRPVHVLPGAVMPPAPSFEATPPLTSLVRRMLPDGSALYLSPEASSSDDFTLERVASDDAGKRGERRVAVSVKDGLLRVTWAGHAGAGEAGGNVPAAAA